MSLFDPIDEMFGVGENPGKAYQLQALQALQGVNAPTPEQLQYQLQQMVYQGDITPEQAQAIQQNPSLMQGINSGQGMQAQLQSLGQLQGIANQGGLTPTDQATLNQAMGQEESAQRGSREAILQNAQARGMGGAGTTLLDEMTNQQNSAQAGNQTGLNVAAMAQQRALQALQGAGQMGGQIEGQQFGESAQKAAAQDTINRFNAQNSQNVASQNVAAQNAALQRNADLRQNISDQNTGLANEQARNKAQSYQTAYQDQLQKATGMSGDYNNLAEGQNAAQQQKLGFEGGLIGTAGNIYGYNKMAGALGNKNISSDERKKKDIRNVPSKALDDFLSSIDPKSFGYKDPAAPGANDEENVGVMAQDLEKTPVGKTMVKDTPDGKMVDSQKSLGVVLAALGHIMEMIDKEKAHV